MEIVQLVLASIAFASGGVFMKLSAGVTRLRPTLAFLLLFLVGALLQASAMRRADLGVAYIFVLGLEAVLTLLFSILLFHEHYSLTRILSVALIIAGIIGLRYRSL